MTIPTLSIIMPVYNAEAYLHEAVESILAQTYTDFELIIIEDGSTDNSREIIESFNDRRVQVLYNDGNQGIVYTRNRGNAAASGLYIAPFDADDIAREDKFEKQISFLEANPQYGMVGSWAKRIDKSGKEMPRNWKVNAKPERIPAILLFRNYFIQSAIVLRREAIPDGGYAKGFDAVEDYLMWIQVAQQWKVWNYPEYLLKYRIHEQGITKRESAIMPDRDDKVFRNAYKTLEIKPDGHQCRLLQQIKSDNPTIDAKTLKEIESFLLLILQQNDRLRIYDQRQLKKVVQNRWLKVCYRASLPVYKRVNIFLGSTVLWNKRELEVRSSKLEGGIDYNNISNKPTADLSIIAANYNNGRYLDAFITSVWQSSAWPKELIIVDDGSTDDSRDVLAKHAGLSFLKTILFEKNKGFTEALNAALEAASGKYIMRADPDDILLPARIKAQFAFMEQHPEVDVLGSNVAYFREPDGACLNVSNFPLRHEEIAKTYRRGEHGLQHPTAFAKASVYKAYRYQEIFPAEDYEIFSRMVRDGRVFANLPEPLYRMRIHEGSATGNLKMAHIEQTFLFRDQIFGTRTSHFKIWRHWNHIRFYRKSLQTENPIKRLSCLALSALFHPRKMLKRLH